MSVTVLSTVSKPQCSYTFLGVGISLVHRQAYAGKAAAAGLVLYELKGRPGGACALHMWEQIELA